MHVNILPAVVHDCVTVLISSTEMIKRIMDTLFLPRHIFAISGTTTLSPL